MITAMNPLTTDLSDPEGRPYFLWDEERTTGEFRRALAAAPAAERYRLIGTCGSTRRRSSPSAR